MAVSSVRRILNSNLPSLKIFVKEITFSFNNQTDKNINIANETGNVVTADNIVGLTAVSSNHLLTFVLSSNKSQLYGYCKSTITGDVKVMCVFFYV